MNILSEIAEKTLNRIKEKMEQIPLEKMKEFASNAPQKASFEKALSQKNLSQKEIEFICEIKKASPSKGLIAPDFDYINIAKEYQQAGAAAISVLTEPFYFMGHDDYLQEISKIVTTPLLRKDFTVHEYMIYEAKAMGASAILLIAALLDTETIKRYIQIADSLGLDSLVEVHDEEEMKSAITAGSRIIGVNNRNLKTFDVDLNLSKVLRPLAPANTIFVAESGIHTANDIKSLSEVGIDAVLIGESIMRSSDKKAKISELKAYFTCTV